MIFKYSQVMEKLLMYEKRIESSLYKAMNDLQKLHCMRKQTQAEFKQPTIPKASGFEAATYRGRDTHETQGRDALATEAATQSEDQISQFVLYHCGERMSRRAKKGIDM